MKAHSEDDLTASQQCRLVLRGVFDAAWKANQRNVRLLERWLDEPARAERASFGFVMGVFGVLSALVVLSLLLTLFAVSWLVGSQA